MQRQKQESTTSSLSSPRAFNQWTPTSPCLQESGSRTSITKPLICSSCNPRFSVLLTHFLSSKWNSYSHIPEPLNLVPNLPSRPSLHVPTLPNINAQKLHTVRAHYWGEGLKERGGDRAHAFVLAWTLSVSGEIKKGSGWLSNLVGHSNGKPHYCTLASIDSCSHCCDINSVHEWTQTQDSVFLVLLDLLSWAQSYGRLKAPARLHDILRPMQIKQQGPMLA